MNRCFFNAKGGEPNEKIHLNPGTKVLCKLLDSIEDKSDLWLVFELCGRPLSKQLYEVKGEFYKGERIYSVLHNDDVYELFEE
jgi:hypothetical protein